MTVVFHYQKTLQYLSSLSKQITQLRQFGKKLAKFYEGSSEDIIKIMEYKNQIISKSTNRVFKKDLNNLDFLSIEKDQCEDNLLWVNNHLDSWIQMNSQPIKNLTQQAKKLQSKRLNKTLKQEEIQAFKLQLENKSIQLKKSIQEIIKSLSQWNVKKCCGLLQNLTTIMQKSKAEQKKRSKSHPNHQGTQKKNKI